MKLRTISLFIVIFLLNSCATEYSELVKEELASGVRQDSIFLGFRFGDTKDDFFSRGWDLNRKGLVMQGPGNRTVQYILNTTDSLGSPIQLLFYPAFDKGKAIKEMEVTFAYKGWSPWNKRFSSDSLLCAVRDTLMNWYGGNEFIQIDVENKSFDHLWVKVDGNRRIVVHKKSEKDVFGKISDLLNDEVMSKNKL